VTVETLICQQCCNDPLNPRRDIVRDQGSQPAESGFGLADSVAVWGFVLPCPTGGTPVIMTRFVIYLRERGVSDLAHHPHVALCHDHGR
jgi:hypothetical protein